MPPKQQQKQKQTVIVNIGDKVVKRKRKRKAKPRRKAPSVESIAYQEAVQGGLPLFIRTQMPTASNVQTDKVLFQLADVTKQLNYQLRVSGVLVVFLIVWLHRQVEIKLCPSEHYSL